MKTIFEKLIQPLIATDRLFNFICEIQAAVKVPAV